MNFTDDTQESWTPSALLLFWGPGVKTVREMLSVNYRVELSQQPRVSLLLYVLSGMGGPWWASYSLEAM